MASSVRSRPGAPCHRSTLTVRLPQSRSPRCKATNSETRSPRQATVITIVRVVSRPPQTPRVFWRWPTWVAQSFPPLETLRLVCEFELLKKISGPIKNPARTNPGGRGAYDEAKYVTDGLVARTGSLFAGFPCQRDDRDLLGRFRTCRAGERCQAGVEDPGASAWVEGRTNGVRMLVTQRALRCARLVDVLLSSHCDPAKAHGAKPL